eukprot:1156056-Pelagomonas_calceolata.AAC.7
MTSGSAQEQAAQPTHLHHSNCSIHVFITASQAPAPKPRGQWVHERVTHECNFAGALLVVPGRRFSLPTNAPNGAVVHPYRGRGRGHEAAHQLQSQNGEGTECTDIAACTAGGMHSP